MPNCEGRSRRSGVILYSDDNDHCVVYTSPPPTAEPLLKEKPLGWVHFSACTKRCVPPHPLRSAQHLPPSGGRLLLSCISSCLTNLTNDRTQPRLIPASNHAPWQRTAQLDAGLAKPDRRGKAGSERRKACFHPGGSGFHLPRGRGGSAAFQFYQLDFYVTTQPSLVLSWAPRKYRPPFVPLLLTPQSSARSQDRGC